LGRRDTDGDWFDRAHDASDDAGGTPPDRRTRRTSFQSTVAGDGVLPFSA